MELSRELIKTDKNGTEYYSVRSTCSKCGGTGYIGYFHYNENGICFACNGAGFIDHTEKVYTPEYAAKLEANRESKRQKAIEQAKREAAGHNRLWMEKEGFSEEGKTYVVLGNTYEIKEKLKEAGAKYRSLLGWVFPFPQTDFPTVEVDLKELTCINYCCQITWIDYEEVTSIIKEKKTTAESKLEPRHISEYIGEVGDTVELALDYVNCFGFDTQFGTTWIHQFRGHKGNSIIWKTGVYLVDLEKGERYTKVILKGKIKELSEYKGEKQTILTRCKLVAGEV